MSKTRTVRQFGQGVTRRIVGPPIDLQVIPRSNVSTPISDIFFNTDVRDCVNLENGQFDGYDHEKMLAEAKSLIFNLEQLGVACPTPEELVQDFYRRV